MPIRILVVDDHKQIHDIISRILDTVSDIIVVGNAANGRDAVMLADELHPDLILMDVVMPVMDGIQAAKLICNKHPEIKILVLSNFHDHESVYQLLREGAIGYIVKDSLASNLLGIIRTAMEGQAVISKNILKEIITPQNSPADVYKFKLTDRELEVLVLMADGLTMQQMAGKLAISLSTIKYHSANIFQKLGAQNRSEALVIALKNNLI
jgi:two-component system, NarL family, response regulator LiaR